MALILAVGCAAPMPQVPLDDVLERALRASVQIVVEQDGERLRTASGVVVARRTARPGPECLILSTAHPFSALATDTQVRVLFDRDRGPGVPVRAELAARQQRGALDLALLRADSAHCTPAQLGQMPRLGDPVWTVGFPWGRGLRLTGGVVSQVTFDERADGGAPARLMIDASVASGASGGGVFDARTAHLLGLVEGLGTARVAFGETADTQYIDVPMPGETYVIAVSTIRRFLDHVGYGDIDSAASSAK
ncbi:MAG: S1 family peptidase [Candidatus Rokuibacteriota bacterium]